MAYDGGDSRIPCKRLAMIGKSLVVGAKKLLREVKVEKVEDTVEERAWFLNGKQGTRESNIYGRYYFWWEGSNPNEWEGGTYNSILYASDNPMMFISGDEQYITSYGPQGEPYYAQKFAYLTKDGWKGEYEMYENGYLVGKVDVTPSNLPEYRLINTSTSTSYEVASDNDYDTFPNGRPEEEE